MKPERFDIERGIGFEDALFTLFEACDPDRDNSWREYGVKFENEAFSVCPDYVDVECTCGYPGIDEFLGDHKHNCYDKEVDRERLRSGWKQYFTESWTTPGDFYLTIRAPKCWSFKKRNEVEDDIYQKLCAKHGLTYPQGCAVHCTCGYMVRVEIWQENIGYPGGHKPECDLERPNFLFKPTGLRIEWYKYPLRDAYSNQEITVEEFNKIIIQCIKSLGKEKISTKSYNEYKTERLAKLEAVAQIAMKDYEGPPIKFFIDI